MITNYRFGELVYQGKSYNKDLIIMKSPNGEEIIPNWWRKEGHLLQIEDLKEVFKIRPAFLIIGTGASGVMKIDEKVKNMAKELGITLEEYPTPKAVERFNELLKTDVSIAGAFHLTC
ncbi:MAG: MTH938/NDUFAF3 family protein [Caldimicrobium sp.]|nr:MTH938/NDUFAF3 family protein [Caldimicrobium sp.]MCX7613810.1 MTH938/NDUFAF3 family protein [Caldimicrobium sp.]MDW8182637.1 MTH938/NDUFAF3 family protein [Caldimicrobium sp.]